MTDPHTESRAQEPQDSRPDGSSPPTAQADSRAGGPPRAVVDRRRRAAAWRSGDVLRTAALVIAMYIVVRLIWFANPLLLTTFLGVLFGLAVSSGVDRLAHFGIRRGVGAPLIVVTFLGLLVGVGAWIAPALRGQSLELRRRIPESIGRLEIWVNDHRGGVIGLLLDGVAPPAHADSTREAIAPSTPGAAGPASTQIGGTARPAADTGRAPVALRDRISQQFSGATKYLFPFISSTFAAVAGVLLVVFLSIYIAVDPALYRNGMLHLVPYQGRARAGEVLSAIAVVLRKWLVTQLIAMVVIFAVTTIVLFALRVKAALALGVIAGLFEFIPTIGPILSSLPGIAMGFLDSPEKALYVAVAYIGVQFLENHLLIPLLMKGGVDLPPALTVVTQALMALVFGFLGLMCAVPLLAASVVAVKMLYVENVVGDVGLGADENPREGVRS